MRPLYNTFRKNNRIYSQILPIHSNRKTRALQPVEPKFVNGSMNAHPHLRGRQSPTTKILFQYTSPAPLFNRAYRSGFHNSWYFQSPLTDEGRNRKFLYRYILSGETRLRISIQKYRPRNAQQHDVWLT